MLEVNKLDLFGSRASPKANTCLYNSCISVCEGHSPVQMWLDSSGSACGEREEGNLCGQIKGGGMGWRWSLAQSSCMIPVAVETTACAAPITSLYVPKSHLFCVS